MTNSAVKVGDIFREAGVAFHKLSELTSSLYSLGDAQPAGKWTDEEIEMLRSSVHRFALDLNRISQHIKGRTVSQIRTTLKKKAFEDAGVRNEVARQVSTTVTSTPQLPAQVTLNMLNATEHETDVESLDSDVKLEFETSSDDVAP